MPMTVSEQREWFRSHTQAAVWCMTRPETTWGRTFLNEGALGRIATEDCEDMISRDVEAAGGESARSYDALHVPNGDFYVQFSPARSGELSTYKFRIHLVQSGTLAGQRIIKHQMNGTYRGFGFITREGGFSLWQRFQRDVNAPYVEAAIYLIRALAAINHDDTSNSSITFQVHDQTMTWGDGDRDLRISAQHRCVMCNNLVAEGQMRDIDPIALCRTHQHMPVDHSEPELPDEIRYDDEIRMPVVDESSLLRCELGTGEVR